MAPFNGAHQAEPPRPEFIVFIGGPTAAELYEAAKRDKMAAGLVGLTNMDPSSVEYATKQLSKTIRNLELDGKSYLLIYCMLETYTYIEENGRRSYYSENNILHLEGPICFGTKSRLEPAIKKVLPLYDACKDAPKVTLTPTPQFMQGPCCQNPAHATNAGAGPYAAEIKQNLATVGRNIREVLSANNIRKHRTLNTTSTILDVPREVAWDSQGGKLSNSAYKAVLTAVISESAALLHKRALPAPKKPPAKRHHSDQGPAAEEARPHRRHESEPSPYRRSENSPERRVSFRDEPEGYRYRY